MSRYTVVLPWSNESFQGSFALQVADLLDNQTGRTHIEGAYRVVNAATGKPVKQGKGGTVPFKGESAWSDGARLLRDLVFAERVGDRFKQVPMAEENPMFQAVACIMFDPSTGEWS